jgi:hypothetical protein
LKTTALNFPIKGDRGRFRDVNLIEIPFRDENGILKSTSQLDEEVFAAVTKTKDEGRHVVFTMDQSKLGYQSLVTI